MIHKQLTSIISEAAILDSFVLQTMRRQIFHRILRGQSPHRCFAKHSYYNSQAGVQVTYFDSLQVHAVLSQDAGWGQTGVETVRGLASIAADGGSGQLLLPPFACDDGDSEKDGEDIPERVIYLPPDAPADVVAEVLESKPGIVSGCHIAFPCDAPREDWDAVLQIAEDAKARGLNLRVTMNDALRVRGSTLSLAASLLADAGADLLVLEAVGMDADEDDLEKAFEEMNSNDVFGIPMSMRVGVRFGLKEADNEDELKHARVLATHAASIGIIHFDVCPLGRIALSPPDLAAALQEAGVETRLNFDAVEMSVEC